MRQNALQIISKTMGTRIQHTDFMLLLNHINKFDTASTQTISQCTVITPNTTTQTQHVHFAAPDHQYTDTFLEQLKLSPTAVKRTIAKLVTLSFERRKKMSAHLTTGKQ